VWQKRTDIIENKRSASIYNLYIYAFILSLCSLCAPCEGKKQMKNFIFPGDSKKA
jgi:hypothetical protein